MPLGKKEGECAEEGHNLRLRKVLARWEIPSSECHSELRRRLGESLIMFAEFMDFFSMSARSFCAPIGFLFPQPLFQ
jgi:hypothetical protein